MPSARLAPAKVNLGLHVLRRRPDGFHDLRTVFLPLTWADRLTATPAPALALTCSDPGLPTDARNLVWQAAEAVARWAAVTPRVRLHLDKRVPYGAGLGSGSSDAAAAARLVAALWEVEVPPRALHALAAELGADVPFFLDARPALALGRGDELTPLLGEDGTPYRCPFALCIAVPPVHVATAEAFRLVRPDASPRPDLAAAVRSNDLGRWRRELTNDFEAAVGVTHPEIAAAKRKLLDGGAGWAAMSGSGSSVVGAFERAAAAGAAADALAAAGCRVWVEPPGV